jgi:hypothetical protein
VAAKHNTQVLEKGSEWAKQGNLNLKCNILLAQDTEGKPALQLVKYKHVRESEGLEAIGILQQFLSNLEPN